MISINPYNSKLSRNQDLMSFKILTPVKPIVRRSSSNKYPHVMKNRKLKQLKEERYTEIERENRILLEKIHSIMSKKAHSAVRRSLDLKLNKIKPKRFYEKKSSRCSHNDCSLIEPERFPHRSSNSINPYKVKTLKKLILFQQKTIEGRKFEVKIFECEGHIKILAEDIENTFLLRLSLDDANDMMRGRRDWKILLDSLYLENKNLILCRRRRNYLE